MIQALHEFNVAALILQNRVLGSGGAASGDSSGRLALNFTRLSKLVVLMVPSLISLI
jgi:hypothetical protein